MTVAEQVYQQTQTLPQSMQIEALHYIEFLKQKLTDTARAESQTENKPSSSTTYSKHEEFNFNLERMDKALASGFVEMPDGLNSPDEIGEWLLNIAE